MKRLRPKSLSTPSRATSQATPLADLFSQPVRGAAWKTKPTFYIVAADDQAVHPELQRHVAKRMNAKTTELASSHMPMLSQPQRVYEVIREAAKAVQVTSLEVRLNNTNRIRNAPARSKRLCPQ